jgi:hypothetical protein
MKLEEVVESLDHKKAVADLVTDPSVLRKNNVSVHPEKIVSKIGRIRIYLSNN